MFSKDILDLAQRTVETCKAAGQRLALAESCTGGLIAGAITAVPGSSDVLERGFVTYSNDAKTEMLGVPAPLIAEVGAVSEEVARAMAEGALSGANAHIAASVTGIAGPGGGTADKPVGLVHMAVATKSETIHQRHVFSGDRDAVRAQSIKAVLTLILQVD